MHNEPDGDVIVPEVVHERAAAGLVVQGPAEGVLGQTGHKGRVRHLPELLDADAVLLGLAPVVQVEARLQLLGQRTAHALPDQGVLGVQLDAGLIVRTRLAILADPEDAGHDALDRPIGIEDQLRGRHARVDLDPKALGVLGQPATDIAQAGDVVAVVEHPLGKGRPADVELTARA